MTYVDGFVIVVPKKNITAYKKMAQWGAKVWMKHGALQYVECVGDDLKAMPGCKSFTQLTKAKPGETVFFSFITYKSKAQRNAVNKRVMKDMEKAPMPKEMPFKLHNLVHGGFNAIVEK